MKDLQVFNVYNCKKVFQINHVFNYFGGTSSSNFTRIKPLIYKTGVLSELTLVFYIYSRFLGHKLSLTNILVFSGKCNSVGLSSFFTLRIWGQP